MDKHTLPKKKPLYSAVTIAIVGLSALFAACEPVPDLKAPPGVATVAGNTLATKEQAMSSLMALPELKAWSERIEKDSGGKLHGALMEYDAQPKIVGGKRYWQFSFVENGSDAARRWESFLVSDKGDEILIDDAATNKPLTLADWRAQKRPMEQTGAQ